MAVVFKNDNYNVNELFDDNGNKYYLCIPTSNLLEYEIYFGFSKDNVSSEENINIISSIYDRITTDNKKIIYLSINVLYDRFHEAGNDNDDKLFEYIYMTLKSVFGHAYDYIIREKVARINQIITAVKQDDDDIKFINWLETKREMFGYIRDISLNNKEIFLSDSADEGGGNNLTGVPTADTTSLNSGFVKKKVPKNNHGFGNISFIILVLIIAFVLGIGAAFIIINK